LNVKTAKLILDVLTNRDLYSKNFIKRFLSSLKTGGDDVSKLADDKVTLLNTAKRTLKDKGLLREGSIGPTWRKPDKLTVKDEMDLSNLYKEAGPVPFSKLAQEEGFKPSHIRKFLDKLKDPKIEYSIMDPPPEMAKELASIKDTRERFKRFRELSSKLKLEKALEKWKVD
jgi:hypothetical protein